MAVLVKVKNTEDRLKKVHTSKGEVCDGKKAYFGGVCLVLSIVRLPVAYIITVG